MGSMEADDKLEEIKAFSPDFRQAFWQLTDPNDSVRIKATARIYVTLQEKQRSSSEVSKSSELDYSVSRLIKGLASGRKFARVGFTLALTQILRQFPIVTVDDVLQTVKEQLKINKHDTKQEKGQVYTGQVMAYLALIRADRLKNATGEQVGALVKELKRLSGEKSYLEQLCVSTIADLSAKVSTKVFKKTVLPVVNDELTCGWEKCTPNVFLLLLKLSKSQPKVISPQFLSNHWKQSSVVCQQNFSNIADILMQSTSNHPDIHSCCTEVLQQASQEFKVLKAFWKTVIDGVLFSHQAPKKYLGFHLVEEALKKVKSVEMVKVIFSDVVLANLVQNMYKDKLLFPAAQHLVECIINFVKTCPDSQIQTAIITRVISPPGQLDFDNITKTRTVATLCQHLNAEATKSFAAQLMDVIRGESKLLGSAKSEEDLETQRKWAIPRLQKLMTNASTAADRDWVLNLTHFFFLHGFFDVKKESEKVVHCSGPVKIPFSDACRHSMQEAFTKSLTSRCSFQTDKKTKDPRAFFDISYEVATYAQDLLENPEVVTLLKPFSEKVQTEWDKALAIVKKIRSKSKESSDSDAFQLLFLHLALQLLVDPASIVNALQDVHVCYEKAFQKKRKSMAKKIDADVEPAWVEVLTEMLLSLLSQSSYLLRMVVDQVFKNVCPHLNREALQLILDVFSSAGDGDEDPIGFDEIDDDADMSEASEQVDADNAEEMSESSESEEEEEEEEEDIDVDESFRNTVKAVLGKAADESEEEESEEELDDEAMFRLDDALSEAFKSHIKSRGKKEDKEKKIQLMHFKIRALDLIRFVIENCTAASMILDLVFPLIHLIDGSNQDKDAKPLLSAATQTFSKLCKVKKIYADPDFDKTKLPNMLNDLVHYLPKVVSISPDQLAGACLLVMHAAAVDSGSEPSPIKTRSHKPSNTQEQDGKGTSGELLQVLENALKNYFSKRDSHFNHLVFHNVLVRLQTSDFWPLSTVLLHYAVDANTRVFCKTQAFSMLAALLKKTVIKSIDAHIMEGFENNFVQGVSKVVEATSPAEVKTKYFHELLLAVFSFLSNYSNCEIDKFRLLCDKLQILKSSFGKDNRTLVNKIQAKIQKRSKKSKQLQ